MGVRTNMPTGLHLHIDPTFAPGFRRANLPLKLYLPGPLGSDSWKKAVGKSRKSAKHVPPTNDPKLEKFKKELIAMQVADRQKRGRKAVLGVIHDDLRKVAGGTKEMHKDVAKKFDEMWNVMHPAFKARKDAKPGDSVWVASAYRSADEDQVAWQNAFVIYYNDTFDDRAATGDPYGAESLLLTFKYMNGKKAPAGYSGHTRGIAADLSTKEAGNSWGVISQREHQLGWQKTWLYNWLCENAFRYGFYQLRTETWHWEWHDTEKDALGFHCWAGKLAADKRPVPPAKGKHK